MNIVKNIDQYNDDYVYFNDPIKNNVMPGCFIRILYSTQDFVLNGIYININLKYKSIEKYYNKFKCTFDVVQHKELVNKLQMIEEMLLEKYKTHEKYINKKKPQYKIYDQIKQGHIKVFSDSINKDNVINFLLKIAGIWETDAEYGLTYKFIIIN
jgi:hypothetical protein